MVRQHQFPESQSRNRWAPEQVRWRIGGKTPEDLVRRGTSAETPSAMDANPLPPRR